MPRKPRKTLKFDEESVNNLFQEIYNDNHNIKAKIARLFTKWEQHVKEGGEIQAIGDQIVKLISAEAKYQDQKLILLRYLKEIVFDKTKNSEDGSNESKGKITSDDRNKMISEIRKNFEQDSD